MRSYIDAEITKVFPKISSGLGQTLWLVFTGGYPQGTYRNVTLPNSELVQGTWRYWAETIMSIKCKKGEKYMDYFKSHAPPAKIRSAEKKLKKARWKLADEGIRLDAGEKLSDEMTKIMRSNQK